MPRYDRNVHAAARKAGKKDAPDCVVCHGSHGAAPVRSGVPGGWSETFLGNACRDCHAKQGDPAARHAWLYQAAFHLQGPLTCGLCHAAPRAERKGHALSREDKVLRECIDCHAPGSALMKRLGPAPEGLFLAAAAERRFGYVMGATRLKLLDIAGGLMVAATFLGMVLGHGSLRLLTARFRRPRSDPPPVPPAASPRPAAPPASGAPACDPGGREPPATGPGKPPPGPRFPEAPPQEPGPSTPAGEGGPKAPPGEAKP
jgi:hypothetical protein